jgi:glycosyltransferase involved in cell wall biosynthesis
MSEVDVVTESSHVAIKERTADILIAIPTFNNEDTVSNVLRAARTALFQFSKSKALIVHVDGGSTDSTMKRAKDSLDGEGVLAQVSYPVYPHQFGVSHHSLPGRDSAYRTIFSLAGEVDAKVCCIVDCGTTVTPDWVSALIQPVLEMEFDLVAPFYKRHKYDGVLVNGMLYPVARALFGKRLRQPIGGDAGYSRTLIRKILPLETWTTAAARRDVSLWLSIQALLQDMKICQVRLGARPRPPRDMGQDISSILADLTGALYLGMEQTADLWQRVRGSTTVPTFGLRIDPETGGNVPDTKPLVEAFRIGCKNLQDLWQYVLPPATLLEFKRMSRQNDREFRFSRELWARVVYDFAVAFRLRAMGQEHLLRTLTPLYMGWVASYILSIEEADADQVEKEIEKVCMAYEAEKPYLISRWRWPDRFMP